MNETSRLLALETTDLTGSVALCEKGEVLGVRPLDPEQRSAFFGSCDTKYSS